MWKNQEHIPLLLQAQHCSLKNLWYFTELAGNCHPRLASLMLLCHPNAPLSFKCLLKVCLPSLPVGLEWANKFVQRGKSCGTEDFSYSAPYITVSVMLSWLIFLLANVKRHWTLNSSANQLKSRILKLNLVKFYQRAQWKTRPVNRNKCQLISQQSVNMLHGICLLKNIPSHCKIFNSTGVIQALDFPQFLAERAAFLLKFVYSAEWAC